MTEVVWKYRLPLDGGPIELSIALNATLLTVATQNDQPCLWVQTSPGYTTTIRTFKWVGTGHPEIDVLHDRYVGTVMLQGGRFVFHLYEVLP